jgi:glycosyltransferase involved in cell wall biosynthesis
MRKLAVVVTHPIQYYAPVFKLLAKQVDLMVFYTWGEASLTKHDPGFGKTIKWDIDLLDGYKYTWVNNTATDTGSHHFKGIVNPDLIKQLELWGPDTLLIYGWAYKSHLAILRHFKNKIPVLFRGDSTLLDNKPGIKNLFKYVYLRWVYRHINYAFYTGLNNKAYFKKYGLKDRQLIFAPHAVDNNRFAIKEDDKVLKLKKGLNLNESDILILFAGKLEEKKDPFLLLKSFINLNQPNVHLLFVGNGVLEPSLKQLAQQHRNIHFMDFQNQGNMPVIYQACDIFCLPSIGPGETWGLAVNEAMACGKTVLVSDKVGCATDIVKPGINGYIHKASSLTDLSQKLKMLINKQKKGLAEMGENSRSIIKHWNFEVQTNSIINYQDQLNG